ncbi:MAG: dihydrofolate reductase [Planctomycetaceae bacterium]|jgi:dihydrofolate reductase|nr:dihydrofolate reductase [Planctomycetaceae bacterium]MBT7253475.1 dihydrofolate reductase [Planctomycetaceae bacterium]
MALSIIVAISQNGVIGREMDLPWHISADLKRFKALTMGHHIVMGRKTYESIGRLLPGRTTVIITRQSDYQIPGAFVVNSIERALTVAANDQETFIVGGSQIYNLALPLVDRLYITRVHADVEGDTRLDAIDWSIWKCENSERHSADEKNDHDYSFEIYRRTS